LSHSLHETGSTSHIALPSEEDGATATGNMYKKFGEMWSLMWFLNMQLCEGIDNPIQHNLIRRA